MLQYSAVSIHSVHSCLNSFLLKIVFASKSMLNYFFCFIKRIPIHICHFQYLELQ